VGDEVRELTRWTLVADSGARRDVELPGRLEPGDGQAAPRATLEATVDVPPDWRDGPLTLALPLVADPVTLSVDGRPVPPHDRGLARTWDLREAAAGAPTLRLRLEVDERVSHWMGMAPRLSPTRDGDAWSLSVASRNELCATAGGAVVGFATVLYLALFLLDRRRTAHGWFALQAAAATAIAAHSFWWRGAGPAAPFVLGALAITCNAAAVGFYRAYFGWRRAARPLWLGVAAMVGLQLVALNPPWLPVARVTYLYLLEAWQLVVAALLVVEQRRGADRLAPAIFAFGWILVPLVNLRDAYALSEGGSALIRGYVYGAVALAVFCVLQAVVLGRDHVRALREAEARVSELEARGLEVAQLNEELRHQVAERSRELTDALARTEGSVAPPALDVGSVFDGRYRVTRALGKGGMGAVYEVERARDGRRLALKVVTRELSGRAAARFAREAEIGARVRHDNLVSIVDVGIAAGGTPFLLMELVRGGSMEEQRARFGDAAWARPLLRQIAAGLAELHANRIVHRDLKPANVLLLEGDGSSAPVAKISDFGISRFGELDDGEADGRAATPEADPRVVSPREASPLTQTGALIGTPHYMPPEALMSPARHPSADVFSLGILAYEALTGRPPFAVPPVMLVRAGQPVPAPAVLDGVSAQVGTLVLACLRTEPADRPRASDVADTLA
jgi:serine/threonine-protein kinase